MSCVNGTNIDDLKSILVSMVPHIPTLNEVRRKQTSIEKKKEVTKEKERKRIGKETNINE